MGQRKRAFIYAAGKRGELQYNGLNDKYLGQTGSIWGE